MTPDWQAINAGPTPSLDEYAALEKADPNAFWRLDSGHHQNLLDAALAEVERHCRDGLGGAGDAAPGGVSLVIETSGQDPRRHTAGGSMVSAKRWGKTAAASAATEAALRERVAQEIEAHADRLYAAGSAILAAGCLSAARIARGQG